MTELKLSDEQIERAAKAACNRFTFRASEQRDGWDTISPAHRNDWKDRVEAAAPYLQVPIAEPEPGELREIASDMDCYASDTITVITEFIKRRNAALTAKPDPRREAIMHAIADYISIKEQSERMTDRILAALDKVQK